MRGIKQAMGDALVVCAGMAGVAMLIASLALVGSLGVIHLIWFFPIWVFAVSLFMKHFGRLVTWERWSDNEEDAL